MRFVVLLIPILAFLYFVVTVLMEWLRPKVVEKIIDAYKRGDYQTALATCEGLKENGKPTPDYYFFRGEMLLHQRQLKDAEYMLRLAVPIQKDQRKRALVQSSIGHANLQQSRPDKAMECFEESLRDWHDRAASHRDMAEAYLAKENNTEALRWARYAVEKERFGTGVSAEERRVNLGMNLAILAWAMAVNSESPAKVEAVIEEAVLSVGISWAPEAAKVHTCAGNAWVSLGQKQSAVNHFETAAKIDPHGLWGHKARFLANAHS